MSQAAIHEATHPAASNTPRRARQPHHEPEKLARITPADHTDNRP